MTTTKTTDTKPVEPCDCCGTTAATVRFKLRGAVVADATEVRYADPDTERTDLWACGRCAALWAIAAKIR